MTYYNNLSRKELIKLLKVRDQEQTNNQICIESKCLSEMGIQLKMFFDDMPVEIELYDRDGYLVNANNTDLKIFESTFG